MKKIDVDVVEQIINAIIDAGNRDKAIYLIGNGGSAVTASHLARDIGIGTRSSSTKPFKAISLVDNVAVMTAIANDEDFSKVFIRQLEAVLEPGDLIFALSVSGNSPNILEAIQYARKRGAFTIGCTGFDGGELRKLVDINLHIQSPRGEYGPVEDIFMILGHLINSYLQMNRACSY
jgi:D-sedoheptulose 7-phosphate isomerase